MFGSGAIASTAACARTTGRMSPVRSVPILPARTATVLCPMEAAAVGVAATRLVARLDNGCTTGTTPRPDSACAAPSATHSVPLITK
jgi:hypothetical protein